METATFGAGCFWHVQADFDKTPGVLQTTVGYTGGKTKNPTYKDVCSDTTGHVEVCQVIFDPKKVAFEKLLKVFWESHDPTQIDRQGPDVGTQYRSVIFYHTPDQKRIAEKSKTDLEKKLGKKIATSIERAADFYAAEEYHQKYYEKHGITGKVC